MLKTIAKRPGDPSKISFDPSCFEAAGYRSVWVIVFGAGSASYPERYMDEETAKKRAKVLGRKAIKVHEPIMRRVSWT